MTVDLPTISVITPVLNRKDTLGRSMASVANQRYPKLEHLIIDGGSTDGSLEVIAAFQKQYPAIRSISEKDDGVYSAMNKGLSLCKGDWIYFLGADDEFADMNVLHDLCREGLFDKEQVVYGDVMIVGTGGWAKDKQRYDGEFDLAKLFRKNICHQSIFYPHSVLDKVGKYNVKYRVTADWDYNIRCWSVFPFRYTGMVIATFQAGGVSSGKADSTFFDELPENVIRHFGIDPMDSRYNYPDSPFFYPVARFREKSYKKAIDQLREEILNLKNEIQVMTKPGTQSSL